MTPNQSATLNRISKERTGLNFSEMISRGNISVSTVDTIMDIYTDEIILEAKADFSTAVVEINRIKKNSQEATQKDVQKEISSEASEVIAKPLASKKVVVKAPAPLPKKPVKKSNKK